MKTTTKIMLCQIVMIAVVIIPFLIMCIINWDEWFDFSRPQGWKVSIGFIISLIVFLLLMFKALKCEVWVYALIIGLVFYLLSGIMDDIYTMAFVESIGLFVYARLNKFVNESLKPQRQMEKNAKINAKANYAVFKENKTPEQLQEETGW